MKRILAIIIGIGIVACAAYFLLFHHSEATIMNYPSSGKNIIAFGDSLVKGNGSTPGNDFVTVLSRELGTPILNEGVSGNTSAQGLARIDEVLRQDPKIVLVLLGGNDTLQEVPIKETFSNIEKIIQKIQAQGAMVILLGVPSDLLTDKYAAQYEALAKKYNTGYVPNILSGLLGHEEYMSDLVHPNDKGYALIAERVLPILKKLIQ